MVGASLEVMERDAKKMRGDRPFIFANFKEEVGIKEIIGFIEAEGMLALSSVVEAGQQSRREKVPDTAGMPSDI